jgi:excisionase family DNA binding protein
MSGSNRIDPMVVDEEQAARMLGISRRMVFEFRAKGELPHVKFGRLIRYRVSDIQAFLERKLIENDSQANGRRR